MIDSITIYITILFTIIMAIAVIFFVNNNKTNELKRLSLYVVEFLERTYGTGTDENKYDNVSRALYEKLPAKIKDKLTQEEIDDIIDKCIELLEEKLKQNIK
jgi:hypothetical protein